MVRGIIQLQAHGENDEHDKALLESLPSRLMSAPYVLLRAATLRVKTTGPRSLSVDMAQIGPPIMSPILLTLYALRHVATGQIMPQMKRGRGYSHWNPAKVLAETLYSATNIPRLLTSLKQARKCRQLWSQYPNAATTKYETAMYGGGKVGDMLTKSDGRKLDDLEIVAVYVVFNDVNEP